MDITGAMVHTYNHIIALALIELSAIITQPTATETLIQEELEPKSVVSITDANSSKMN